MLIGMVFMGKSRRKSPYVGNTGARSEKQDKRIANRRFRHKNKQYIKLGLEPIYNIREISDVWIFDKDGKRRINKKSKMMRK